MWPPPQPLPSLVMVQLAISAAPVTTAASAASITDASTLSPLSAVSPLLPPAFASLTVLLHSLSELLQSPAPFFSDHCPSCYHHCHGFADSISDNITLHVNAVSVPSSVSFVTVNLVVYSASHAHHRQNRC